MGTATLTLRSRATSRFTPIDGLYCSIWAALTILLCALNHASFIHWSLVGGGVMIAIHLWRVVYRGQESENNLLIAAVSPLFMLASGYGLGQVNKFTPVVYDDLLARWDFGMAANFRALCSPHALLMRGLEQVYYLLPLVMLLCISVCHGHGRKCLLYSVALAGILCIPCYFAFPAVGPAHVGDQGAPRNCMPSMHCAWALMLWINSKGYAKWLFGLLTALTFASTITTGEHYVPDLVAAVPFTAAITWLVRKYVK
jgi:hypothetical protein